MNTKEPNSPGPDLNFGRTLRLGVEAMELLGVFGIPPPLQPVSSPHRRAAAVELSFVTVLFAALTTVPVASASFGE